MAKIKKIVEENVDISKGSVTKDQLRALLKAKTPALFEKEPAPAFAEGNLNALVEALYSFLS